MRSRRGTDYAYRSRVDKTHVESAYAVKPTTIIFMGIDVERNHHLLSHLNIETVEAFLSENREYHLTGVCVMCLNDKILSFPIATS